MSFAAFVWAWEQPIENAPELLVLLCLADISGESGDVFASTKYIADRCRRSERHVRMMLDALEGKYIRTTERPGRTDLVHLLIPEEFSVKKRGHVFDGDLEAGKRGRPRKSRAIGSENSGNPFEKPQSQIADEPKGEPKLEPREGAIAPVVRSETEQAFDAWNAFAEEHDKPPARAFTDQRRRALGARLKECGGLPGWLETLDAVKRSGFLMGSTPERFSVDIDFVLQPSSFTKIREGKYERRHDRQPATGLDRGAAVHDARVSAMVDGARLALDRRKRWGVGGLGE